MQTRVVVAAIIQYQEAVLLVKYLSHSEYASNKWSVPAGFVKEGEGCEQALLRHVHEQTGLDVMLTRSGTPVETVDEHGRWVIIPFLLLASSENIALNKKLHEQSVWIPVADILEFDVVESLRSYFEAVGAL